VRLAKKIGVELRQSYERVWPRRRRRKRREWLVLLLSLTLAASDASACKAPRQATRYRSNLNSIRKIIERPRSAFFTDDELLPWARGPLI
jgi:hypothetical protein